MELYKIVRSHDEIDKLVDWASDGVNDGTRYSGASYEEGILAAIYWLTGIVDEYPGE